MDANVIPKTLKQNSKTPIAVMLLGFFLFKISDEQSDEQFSENVDKQMLNQLVHENVTRLN